MQKADTYLIQWYGPFSSKEDLKEWEDKKHDIVFNLYVFQAKRKGIKDKYYCGMAFEQSVGERMKNKNHHIHEFEDNKTELQIWVGTIANVKANEYDVRICENIITSELAYLGVGDKHLKNKTNKKPPVNNVYIINEWWKNNKDEDPFAVHTSKLVCANPIIGPPLIILCVSSSVFSPFVCSYKYEYGVPFNTQ